MLRLFYKIKGGMVIRTGLHLFTGLNQSKKYFSRLNLLSLFFFVHTICSAYTSTTQQLCTVPVYASNRNQEIIALVITTGATVANVTSITFNTAGTTAPLTNISNAKCWYSNSCPVIFANCASGDPVQFGATIAAPNGAITFVGSQALAANCVYYFWLTYDIPAGATVGAVVDGQCTSVTYGTTQAPTVTSPAGSRTINAPLPNTNLIPNPSFEGICPYTTGCSVLFNGISEVGIAYPWFCPTSGTSDYQDCGIGAPTAFTPIPPPRTGNCTVGEYFYGFGGYREYVQVPISKPLVAGNTYQASYWVRLSTAQTGCQVKDMSAYFSVGPLFNYGSTTNLPVTAQVTATALTGSSAAWSQVCGCFVATGGETYMTIGNFKTDAATTQVGCSFGYFFIDDASLEDLTATGNAASCGSCLVILPIELLSFNGFCENNRTTINWATSSEKNNLLFVIERSEDDKDFTVIGTVNAEGNSSQTKNYSFVDNKPLSGTSYYRLKQVDRDGKSKYLKTIAVRCKNLSDINIFPNPNSGSFTVEGVDLNSEIIITNIYGDVVFKTNNQSDKMEIDLSTLSKGVYFIKLDSGKQTGFKKVVIN